MNDAAQATQTPRRGGFSLVEILVTLVILLIGVLAILRLFPGGFLTIQRTGELTGAQALSQRQLGDEQGALTLVDDVVGVLPDANGDPAFITDSTKEPRPDDITDFTPDELSAFAGIPLAGAGRPELYSNINRLRGIRGETFRIPTLTPNAISGNAGAIYLLRYGPVFNKFGGAGGANSDRISVYGAPLERTLQSSKATFDRPDAAPVFRSDGQYAIDYDLTPTPTQAGNGIIVARIAFAPRLASSPARTLSYRRFQIRLKYYVQTAGQVSLKIKTLTYLNDPALQVADAQAPPNGDAPAGVWQEVVLIPAAGETILGVRRESDEVSRQFNLVLPQAVMDNNPAVNPVWSDDPYEYAWFSKQYVGEANPGVLVFNPIGRNASVQTSTGPRPFVAKVDYITYDNHIVRDDRQLPAGAPYDLKLSLPQTLTFGDRLEDQTIFNGLFQNNAQTPSLLIFDTSTGEELRSIAGRCLGDPNAAFKVEPRTGTLRLNQSLVEQANLQGANLRVFYRTQKEHGMQVQKAHSHYEEADSLAAIGYNDFFINYSAGGTRLYFPRSESGKSLVLGEYYVETKLNANNAANAIPVNDANGNTVYCRRLTNETYQISTDLDPATSLPYVDVSTQHSEAAGEGWKLTRLVAGTGAVNVQGASLKSRILWRDSTKQVTDTATGKVRILPRWRKLDSDTLLLPKPIQ